MDATRRIGGTTPGAAAQRSDAETAPVRERNEAIDWLRGTVMLLMALDHCRGFLGLSVDMATADAALFFTRWVTHFCAPVFVLLAGMAAYLHGRRLGSTRALAG